ncbi:MAG: pyridoxamine 5'-phosphate oxidase family protein [Acetobacteraceae bacterium]
MQARVGVRERMDARGARAIRDFMPDEHRSLFALLTFLPVATETEAGWPAATILTGPAGFVSSPDPRTLQAREAMAAPPASARSERLPGLDARARAAIKAADTVFVASGSDAGLDMSHRGGRPGFVRVQGDVLTIPDFAGNRYFNTLGNFALNPRAALLFPDFATGEVLHVSGEVEIVWDGDEVRRLPGAQRLWRVHVIAAERRIGTLAPRWSDPEYSPSLAAAEEPPSPLPLGEVAAGCPTCVAPKNAITSPSDR